MASPQEVSLRCLEVEADERGRVVRQKATKPGVWIAMDKPTRHSLALHVGDRRRDRAKPLGAHLPAVYRPQATFDPDH